MDIDSHNNDAVQEVHGKSGLLFCIKGSSCVNPNVFIWFHSKLFFL